MIKAYTVLPEGYERSKVLDLEKNRKLFWFLNIASIVIFIPFLPAFFNHIEYAQPLSLILYLPLMILNIVVHELIHAAFFKLAKGVNIKFKFHGFAASASSPDTYFKKWHYFAVGLAPFIVLNLIYIPFFIFAPLHLISLAAVLLGNHLSSCIGDYIVSIYLLRYKPSTLVKDYGVGMEFYRKS